ncbi:MAG: LarC family nickel insertion protein [Firmicutes bacterium]|nr:LarC family nickel insertion protein [Bacillota bacterium]
MKTLYIDCRGGASGDMTLGAMLSLGVPRRALEEGLESLGLNEFELAVSEKEYHGSPATDVDVILHNKEHAWIHPYSGKYRNYGQIREMIERSGITEHAKALSRRIFDIKAAAESTAHGVPVDEVQFHEVGAVDSIVDVVGTAICADALGADRVVSCHVPTGFGTVECACGTLPVPAPAVQAILKETGLPHYRGDIEQELLTPTGAAILAGIVDEFVPDEVIEGAAKAGAAGETTGPAAAKAGAAGETAGPAGEREAGPARIGRGTGKRDTGLAPLTLILMEE